MYPSPASFLLTNESHVSQQRHAGHSTRTVFLCFVIHLPWLCSSRAALGMNRVCYSLADQSVVVRVCSVPFRDASLLLSLRDDVDVRKVTPTPRSSCALELREI